MSKREIKPLTVRLEPADYDEVSDFAAALGKPINSLVAKIIKDWLESNKTKVQRLKELQQEVQRQAAAIMAPSIDEGNLPFSKNNSPEKAQKKSADDHASLTARLTYSQPSAMAAVIDDG